MIRSLYPKTTERLTERKNQKERKKEEEEEDEAEEEKEKKKDREQRDLRSASKAERTDGGVKCEGRAEMRDEERRVGISVFQ